MRMTVWQRDQRWKIPKVVNRPRSLQTTVINAQNDDKSIKQTVNLDWSL